MLACMATLRVKDSPDARIRNATFELASLPFTIGRAQDSSLALADDGASRRHVAIHEAAEGHWILDLESVNGTFVNGARINKAWLVHGDRIEIGGTTLVFEQTCPERVVAPTPPAPSPPVLPPLPVAGVPREPDGSSKFSRPRRRSSSGLWLAIGCLTVVALPIVAAVGWWWWSTRSPWGQQVPDARAASARAPERDLIAPDRGVADVAPLDVIVGKYPFEKGATVEVSVQADEKTTVGDLEKTGWQLEIPANAFDRHVSLTMNVLPAAAAVSHKSTAFEFIGTPVEIAAGEEERVYLRQPVTVTLQIPKDQRISKEKKDDYLAAYYNGESWDYIFPDITRVSDGYISFETHHFSFFSAVKLTEAEKIELYAQKMAVQAWEDEDREKVFSDKVMHTFNEAFEKMGISDETVRGKLLRSVAKEYDFGTLLVSTERGDVADFGIKCGEMAANALIEHLKMEDALMENITGKGAAVATGLVKGALQLKDGNYTDAAKELGSAFVGYFPVGRAYQATVEVIDAGIASWKDYELDEAYRNYVKDAGSGSAVRDDDWALMCSTQMRGYLIRLQEESKNLYCAVNNGKSRSTLDKDKALSERIATQAGVNLRKTFEKRLASEKVIKKREAEYEQIIMGFRRDGLLERGEFRFEFGMDVERRLRTLFAVRQNVLDLFGGRMPVLTIDESAEGNLNQAIAMWISFGPTNRGEFYKWLEEKGYLKKVEAPGEPAEPTPAPTQEDSSAAPVKLDLDAKPTQVARAGSFIVKTWGGTTMDSFRIGGGELTAASFSRSQGMIIYNVSGTVKPGQNVSLAIAGSQWDMRKSMVGLKHNRATASIRYLDKSGKPIAETIEHDSGESKAPSLSGSVSGSVPADAAKVIMEGHFVCTWASAHTTASEMAGVKVTLTVKK
jgi:hypothetical protein